MYVKICVVYGFIKICASREIHNLKICKDKFKIIHKYSHVEQSRKIQILLQEAKSQKR